MNKSGWIWMVFLIILFLLNILIFVLASLLKPFKAKNQCASYQVWDGRTCSIPRRRKTDKYPQPTEPLILGDFKNVKGIGYPWCTGTYYAYQYIDEKGNYGEMSDWTQVPVIAGADEQPGCSKPCYDFENSCEFNQPVIGVKNKSNLKYTGLDGSGVWAQIYHTTQDPKEGPVTDYSPIGYLLPTKGKVEYGMPDVFDPNTDTPICKNCN